MTTYRITSTDVGGPIVWMGEAESEQDAIERFDAEVGFWGSEGVPADWRDHYRVDLHEHRT